MSRWNPKWNDILEMYFNGATYKEIAEFAGTSLETVAGKFARMRRRKHLDVIMGVYVGDRPPRGIYGGVFVPKSRQGDGGAKLRGDFLVGEA